MNWPSVPIGDLVTIRGGGTPKRDRDEFFRGNIPWVTPKDMKSWEICDSQIRITQDAIQQSAANLVPRNTVLVVVRSGVLKHTLPVAVNRVPVAINQDMKSMECGHRLSPDFLAHFLKASSPIVLSWVRATTADNFSIDNLRELKIPLPALPEQRRIAAILDQADALRRKRQEVMDTLPNLIRARFLELFGNPVTNSLKWKTDKFGNLGELERGVSKHRPRNDPLLLGGPYPLIQTGDIGNADGSSYLFRDIL